MTGEARRMLALVWGLTVACGTTAPDDDTPIDAGKEPPIAGNCAYTNPFSQGPECKEYSGENWTAETAAADCQAPLLSAPAGTFTPQAPCSVGDILGTCVIDGETGDEVILVFPGDNPDDCGGVSVGCSFGGGTFVPADICKDGGAGPTTGNVFMPFDLTCVEPLAGEPAGASEGEVCTWGAISACTEDGRAYADYASCDAVVSQRPYNPAPAVANTPANDPRLTDTAWQAEYAWVTKQVEACACTCCHTEEHAPNNAASGWYLEAGPIWVDTLDDDGLAMLAGWVDSTAFGAFPPEDNNGFDRSTTGLPTNDVSRMVAFLEGELSRRGLTEADFVTTPPFGGPLYDQLVYEPVACTNGEGVGSDGTITWVGGGARYVYIMDADASAPGVPPNLDLPDGTLWRLDVDPTDDPIASGFAYGTVPSGARQAFPASGAPAALTSGATYYVYVLRDVYQPLTRCLFTAP